MRQPQSGQRGNEGETAVKLAFVKLGWGAATAQEFDVGTDLFLLVRDHRLFDSGLMLGAQVKSGSAFFKEPETDATGAVTGWWFRDGNREHTDYWTSHVLPHILVLYDPSSQASYWVGLTPETVVGTGKGVKVFVPAGNVVDEAHRDALVAVAASNRRPSPWEGSAWTGAVSIADSAMLRHALLVPRTVAPRRRGNQQEALTPAQAAAMVVEGRFDELDSYASKNPKTPTLEAAAESPAWAWRFVAALSARMLDGTADRLITVLADAEHPHERAAATVAAAARLLESGSADAAEQLLADALQRDDAAPVDDAWLRIQHARACVERDDLAAARTAAAQAQRIRLTHADDITATAIAGIASLMSFRLADWGQGQLEEAISGVDTLAVWWRSSSVATAVSAALTEQLERWSRYPTAVVFDDLLAHNTLVTTAVLSSHLGDHGAWQNLETLRLSGQILETDRHSDPEKVRDLVSDLRGCGNERLLGKVVYRYVEDGPASGVRSAAAEIDFQRPTRSTLAATLTLLKRAGDVLDTDTASRAVGWLCAALDDLATSGPGSHWQSGLEHELVGTLANVTPSASPADIDAVLSRVLDLPPQPDQARAIGWSRVVSMIPSKTWTTATTATAVAVASSHHSSLRLALLRAAAKHQPSAAAALQDLVMGGSLDALGSSGLGQLPEPAVNRLMDDLETRISALVANARKNSYDLGAHDAGKILAALNLAHPELARWEQIYALLSEPRVADDDRTGCCQLLLLSVEELPDDVRERLVPIAASLAVGPAQQLAPSIGAPVKGVAEALAARLSEVSDVSDGAVGRLLAGDADQRSWAARIALRRGTDTDAGILMVLCYDSTPLVRATAAAGLVHLLAREGLSPAAMEVLRNSVSDPGTLVPRAVAGELAGHRLAVGAEAIRTELAAHISARTRSSTDRAASSA